MTRTVLLATTLVLAGASSAFAGLCTPTGLVRDNIDLTAALINPETVSGPVDATGCNIGVYYGPGSRGVIKDAEIFGANYFGVVANGDQGRITLDVVDSVIRDIGESPHTGSQHGVAIYVRAFTNAGAVSVRLMGNRIWGYQKGGIVANGSGTRATVDRNTVAGDGHIAFISMNGIQIGYGASADVTRNVVSGNSYIGSGGWASGGILVVGGPGYAGDYTTNTRIDGNTLVGNDVGVYLSNLEADGSAPARATNIKAINNTIVYDECFNTIYQAGVSDVGNNDKMIANRIAGDGYAPACGFAVDADPTWTNRPKVHATK
jgi:hypothetical protein